MALDPWTDADHVDMWVQSLPELSWSQQGGQPPWILPYGEAARSFLCVATLTDAAAALPLEEFVVAPEAFGRISAKLVSAGWAPPRCNLGSALVEIERIRREARRWISGKLTLSWTPMTSSLWKAPRG